MDDESCHEREIFVLELEKENALWTAAGRQAKAHGDFLPHQARPAGLCEAGEKGPVGGRVAQAEAATSGAKGLGGFQGSLLGSNGIWLLLSYLLDP